MTVSRSTRDHGRTCLILIGFCALFTGCLAEFPAAPAEAALDQDLPRVDGRPALDRGRVTPDAAQAPDGGGSVRDRGLVADRGPAEDRGPRDRGSVDPPQDAAPRPDMAPTRDRGLRDMAVEEDGGDGVEPDAGPRMPDQGVCEPLQCMTALGEMGTSPCSPQPVAPCGPPGHELCQCGMRDRGFFFDPPLGLGRVPNAVTYVYQPAPGDGRHVRLFLGQDLCFEPMESCAAAMGACAGHEVLTWLLPRGVRVPVVLTVMDHPQCQGNILAQITIN